MNPRAVNRLHDALEAARTVRQYIDGYILSADIDNGLVRSAVERQLEIVGEAINAALRDEPGLVKHIPSLREWVGLRNVLIHAYADIIAEAIWTIATTEIPDLIATLERLLDGDPSQG